jgi:hypothetical protein
MGLPVPEAVLALDPADLAALPKDRRLVNRGFVPDWKA